PRSARQLAIALQEIEISRSVVDTKALSETLDVAEFFDNVVTCHEDLALVDGGVPIRRRDQEPVNVQILKERKKLLDLPHVGLFVNRCIRADLESVRLGDLYPFDGFLEDAFTFNGKIVILFHAVKVNIKEEPAIRFELFDLFTNEHAIRA